MFSQSHDLLIVEVNLRTVPIFQRIEMADCFSERVENTVKRFGLDQFIFQSGYHWGFGSSIVRTSNRLWHSGSTQRKYSPSACSGFTFETSPAALWQRGQRGTA